MSEANPKLPKEYNAEGTIAKYAIVKFGAADKGVLAAAAASDLSIGVAGHAAVSGERIRVDRAGIVEVIAGGAITRGQSLTSDASGEAVTAATGNYVIGIAETSAADGDIFPMLIARHISA